MKCPAAFVSTALLIAGLLVPGGSAVAARATTAAPHAPESVAHLPYTSVVTPNGTTLPWAMENGTKVFRLTVGACKHEIAPGMVINAWCYNDQTPGPTIEAVEGDRVRFLVTNKLPEPTAVHWHGVLLPSGMDGVAGLTQTAILPGETYSYEFTLRQHGTLMYHSHGDEMTQIGMGTMGFFIIHPRKPENPRIDRDFAIFLNEWSVEPGSATPNVNVMTDFNVFTFNSRAFPGTAPLVARAGDRVRIRFGNVGQESHPIHLHGHFFQVTGTDGGDIPVTARWPETTVTVFPGQTRTIEFTATEGDWALHCHRRHHPMNAMGHTVPNMLGVDQSDLEPKIRSALPNYMAMGEKGMHDMAEMHMDGPDNTLPMMAGEGQFGPIGMGGMFTVLKVRKNITSYEDPGWYDNPKGTLARPVDPEMSGQSQGGKERSTAKGDEVPKQSRTAMGGTGVQHPEGQTLYTCPMHPEVVQDKPGKCPKCGMTLVKKK